MKILSARQRRFVYEPGQGQYAEHWEDVPAGVQRRDRMVLEKMHAKACREIPLFDMFGGILRIANRQYQVV